jgi:nicotinate phosphoribosyltransferase
MKEPIIKSLLDTDLYKLTMMQCVLHHFPSSMVEYKFKCRNAINLGAYLTEIQGEVKNLCNLQFTEEELFFLSKLDYVKSDFIEFLRIFKLNSNFIELKLDDEKQLAVTIRGPWLHTILFEVPVLAIINEVYFRNTVLDREQAYINGRQLLQNKINFLKSEIIKDSKIKNFRFTDFGTRRRFSKCWQEEVVVTLAKELPGNFMGTSNVLLAMKYKSYNLVPIGTMAHEFLQACQALGSRLVDSQKYALEKWTQEYRGRLGIALTDVISMDAFLNDFDLFFAKLFDGLRHDSGDPLVWGAKAIAHYKKLKIDPLSKLLIFSDGLTIHSALDIYKYFYGRAKTAYGIGTSLTNDLGFTPVQIVIKMVKCNNQSVAKISDSPGKSLCEDISYINYLKKVFSHD